MCGVCVDSVPVQALTQDVNGLSVASAYDYQHRAIAQGLQAWKYEGILAAVEPFLKRLKPPAIKADLVVPVPLHRRRQLERGFNQAGVLAGCLGEMMSVPVMNSLKRVRYTAPQAQQDREGRLQNVKDAFVWKGEAIIGKRIVLVDDVVTTGSTLTACSVALYAAGAAEVQGWCLCRSNKLS